MLNVKDRKSLRLATLTNVLIKLTSHTKEQTQIKLQPLESWQGSMLTGKVHMHLLLCTVKLGTVNCLIKVQIISNTGLYTSLG